MIQLPRKLPQLLLQQLLARQVELVFVGVDLGIGRQGYFDQCLGFTKAPPDRI